jgi:hypothetical protein
MCARDFIAASLRGVLSEAVPYRVYKWDVRRFFESIHPGIIALKLQRIGLTQGPSGRIVDAVIDAHTQNEGEGLPRGLAISGTLADLIMRDFDIKIEDRSEVFFYRRYVDDIIVVTSCEEDPQAFLAMVKATLPEGLHLKRQKLKIYEADRLKSKVKSATPSKTELLEYLGYSFRFDAKNLSVLPCGHRKVLVDIAPNKVRKIKTRIVKSLLDYVLNKDFRLLDDRLRHLTSNMSMLDRSSGQRRLVGIHFNYPLVDASNSQALLELDRFLANALNSRKGRVYSRLAALLTPYQLARLARHSFVEGAKRRKFFQMGLSYLGKVQRCWKYA